MQLLSPSSVGLREWGATREELATVAMNPGHTSAMLKCGTDESNCRACFYESPNSPMKCEQSEKRYKSTHDSCKVILR
jgi:hypothetical protein